ncbi:hypothetical protein ABIA60_005023 [Pseudomonas frederiksbergensis]
MKSKDAKEAESNDDGKPKPESLTPKPKYISDPSVGGGGGHGGHGGMGNGPPDRPPDYPGNNNGH